MMTQRKLRKIKKRYLKRKILTTHIKIWELEFLIQQLKEMREGFRREYDRMSETIDAARRKIFSENYTFYYSATGDTVDVKNISLTYADLEHLPEKPQEPWRFHKVSKPYFDEKVCENMKKLIVKLTPDIEELKKRMDGVDKNINTSYQNENDGGIIAAMEGYRTVIGLLENYIKTI